MKYMVMCLISRQNKRLESYIVSECHNSTITRFKWNQLGVHIFISTSLHVSANYVPSSEEIAVSMRYWYFSLCM